MVWDRSPSKTLKHAHIVGAIKAGMVVIIIILNKNNMSISQADLTTVLVATHKYPALLVCEMS